MLSMYLLEKRFYPTAVIKGFIVFKNKFRRVPDRKLFADIAANETLGAVQSCFRIFFCRLVTDNSEIYTCQAQIVRNLDPGNRDKTDPGIVKPPGKNRTDNLMYGFSNLFRTFVLHALTPKDEG